MAPLSLELRSRLANAIKDARREAEAGARRALEALAVERHEPHGSMSPEERELRNRLRAHGRQLGDVRDKVRGTQAIGRLVHEVAYEHWHRMLFSRFLAENELLIEPTSGVAISMEECEELARERGENPRAMAASFAQKTLPEVFRSGDPVLEIILAPETRRALERLLEDLPSAVFKADDSLGWTYQYWQAERKDEINKSGVKIGADGLPAVTQLFTEHYMVLFLYHNTIGAWHAGKVLAENPGLAETAQSEKELRAAVRLRSAGGYDFEYLRFVRDPKEGRDEEAPTGPWRPAAGTFDGWPRSAKELKVLDPCCGSGHFLTEGFELLVRLRMEEEGIGLEEAIRGVLAENLHGLEIDPRCTQIAAFGVGMAAWKLAGVPMELPSLSVACSGLAVSSSNKEWVDLGGADSRLRAGMEELYDLFTQAAELGSLIDPKNIRASLLVADARQLQPLFEQALARSSREPESAERALAARGMARAAELLSATYTLVITNVPYLGRSDQCPTIRRYAEAHHDDAKGDLATVFLSRALGWLGDAASVALVTPEEWLFLTSYRSLRVRLLKEMSFHLVSRLGEEAWASFGLRGPRATLFVGSATRRIGANRFLTIDASSPPGKEPILLPEKLAMLREGRCAMLDQADQLRNPDSRVTTSGASGCSLLSDYADSLQGIATADYSRFGLCFWEVVTFAPKWEFQQSIANGEDDFSGREHIVRWECGEGELARNAAARIQGNQGWGKDGVAVTQMRTLAVTRYTGEFWDNNTAVVLPKEPEYLPPIWTFCKSAAFREAVRRIDRKKSVTNATLVKVPFDYEHWQRIAERVHPSGLPEPQSDDPTQWLFHGHPSKTRPAAILQVSLSRLMSYVWPPEWTATMRLADSVREWLARCEELRSFSGEDGIACLSAIRGERSAAERLRGLLAAAFGPDWSASKEREFLGAAGNAKEPAQSLEIWLRDRFFEEHCKLFHHRPFVWHIWDGNRDGFHCLVNAHRLTGPHGEGRRTLEAITYSYLGDWIERQRAEQREGKEGADGRLAAALDLQGQLEKILEGEPPYDLFVRWKPLHEQAIGWEPDINDGVRLNIRPFMNAELRKGGKKGAGILRWKPNIRWGKDRGKEPASLRPKEDFPWFWACPGEGSTDERTDFCGGDEFDGNRWNDLHYTIACKKAVRERSGGGSSS